MSSSDHVQLFDKGADLFRQGMITEAYPLLEQSLREARKCHDAEYEIKAGIELAELLRRLGRIDDATNEATLAKDRADETNRRSEMLRAAIKLGSFSFQLFDIESAKEVADEVLGLSRSWGMIDREADAQSLAAHVHEARDEINHALARFYDVLTLAATCGNIRKRITANSNLGRLYGHVGDYPRALQLLTESDRLVEKYGHLRTAKTNKVRRAEIYRAAGDFSKAEQLLKQAQGVCIESPGSFAATEWRQARARLSLARQDFKAAVDQFQSAYTTDCQLRYVRDAMYDLLGLTTTYLTWGKFPEAHGVCWQITDELDRQARHIHHINLICEVFEHLGMSCDARGDFKTASFLRTHATRFRELDRPGTLISTHKRLERENVAQHLDELFRVTKSLVEKRYRDSSREVDLQTGDIWLGGRSTGKRLEPKQCEIFRLLFQAMGQLIPYRELFAALYSDYREHEEDVDLYKNRLESQISKMRDLLEEAYLGDLIIHDTIRGGFSLRSPALG